MNANGANAGYVVAIAVALIGAWGGISAVRAQRAADSAKGRIDFIDQVQEQWQAEMNRRELLENVVVNLRREVAHCEADRAQQAIELAKFDARVERLEEDLARLKERPS